MSAKARDMCAEARGMSAEARDMCAEARGMSAEARDVSAKARRRRRLGLGGEVGRKGCMVAAAAAERPRRLAL
jgi:hypothetical protein